MKNGDHADKAVDAGESSVAASQKRGGPRTSAGKAKSRSNAVTHGLTSKLLLPKVLRPGRVAELRELLARNPGAILTNAMLDEIARHIARLEIAQQAEEALLREGAREEARRAAASGDCEDEKVDRMLGAGLVSPALELCTRYRRSHERSLHSAWRALAILHTQFGGAAPAPLQVPVEEPRYATEEACEALLKKRFSSDSWTCPRCGKAKGSWLPSRKIWECGGCQRQISLRVGTVMERSPLPLLTWFHAIQLIVQHPEIDDRALGNKLGIERRKTVHGIGQKIREVLADDSRRQLLAGLDTLFQQPASP